MANVTMSGYEDEPLQIVNKISIEDIDETIAGDYYVAVMLQVRRDKTNGPHFYDRLLTICMYVSVLYRSNLVS